MKGFSHFLTLGLLLAAMMVAGSRASAQGFGLSVTPSASSLMVSNSLTYTINVTNQTALPMQDVWITNSFSFPIQYITSTASQNITYSLNTNFTRVMYNLGPVDIGGVVQVNLTIQPNATGFLTNTVVVADTNKIATASTSLTVQVTNLVVQADLGVVMTGPRQVVITNDWMTYGVTISNAGPSAAANVMLTNTLPPGVLLKGIFPKLNYVSQGSNVIFNLGQLINNGSTNVQFTVEPTNIATLTFSASVGGPGITDTNTANNLDSTNVTVTNYLSGPLEVGTSSGQIYDPQDGLVEQFITVNNNTNYTADAIRVVVAGLTVTNWLFNAVGTNSGNPFVYYSTNLLAGQSIKLMLQYAASAYFPLTNGQLHAFAVLTPNWTPPPISITSTNVNISRIVKLSNGNMLIEWPSIANRTYTVVYSDNISFSNAMIAPPSIVAHANQTQWIDYGPPTTVSLPTNTARFYRVYLNP